MTLSPINFDKVDVLEVAVQGPGDANRLFIVSGVAVLNYKGTVHDYNRDNVSFLIPQKGTGNPAPLNIGEYRDSTGIAFPATIQSTTQEPVGWGIDFVDTLPDGETSLRLSAQIAVLNPGGTFIRMGFQVNILAHIGA